MADQTHCHICKRHLQKGGIRCVSCKAYIHVSSSGLQSSKFYYDGFSCIQCSPENFAKEPTSTNRPTITALIITQKPTSTAPITIKEKHHRQHLKQTYCQTQHNLVHRPQQPLQTLRPLETYRPRI